ncbi:MAG TPA: cellulase family glycosylhydrolase [Opitutaceae bacterium]|nr:cellulase family glycosylhydrolase [Opitutaceae bacterium]
MAPAPAKTAMQEYVEAMQPGWNLGNTLDATPTETSWGNPLTTQALIQRIKAEGFKSIRIPVTWDAGTDRLGPAPTYTIDPAFLDRVQQVVDWSLEAGLYVMLNVHHDSYWMKSMPTDHDAVLNKFNAIWSQLAPRFRDYPRELMLESINEPDFFITGDGAVPDAERNALISELNTSFFNIVRGTGGGNATRPLVLPSFNTNSGQQYLDALKATMDSLNDQNLIATVHYYGLWHFSVNIAGRTTVSAEVIDNINYTIDHTYDTFVANGIPVVVGELGLLNWGPTSLSIERGEALKFFEVFTAAARAKGITWQLWDAGQLFDRTTFQWKDPELMAYYMQGLTTRSTTASTDLVFLKKNLPVQDVAIRLNLNGNAFASLQDGATTLQSGVDYTVVGDVLTLKARALSKYATGSLGEKALFTVNATAGVPWKLHVRYVDAPVASAVIDETGHDISVPMAFNGDLLATMEAKYLDGSGMDPATWTSFKEFGNAYSPDYWNNRITLKKSLFDTVKPGVFNVAFRFWSGRVERYQVLVEARSAEGGVEYPIYDDAIPSGWNDWSSWMTHDLANTTPVHSGTKSISITPSAWGGLTLQNGSASVDTSAFNTLVFWVNGGETGGQYIGLHMICDGDWNFTYFGLPPLVANTWQKIEIPLSSLGVAGRANITGVSFRHFRGEAGPTFYIDDVVLTTAKSLTAMDVYGDRAVNPNPQIQITKGGFVLNRRTNRYVQTVVVKNTGATPVTGPLYLIVDGLSANTTLANSKGSTWTELPTGSPYVQVGSGGLAANSQISVTLEFTVPSAGGITYDARVISGGANP